jgi:hypothetical protein
MTTVRRLPIWAIVVLIVLALFALVAWIRRPEVAPSPVTPRPAPSPANVELRHRAERPREAAAAAGTEAQPPKPSAAPEAPKSEKTYPFEVTVLRADGTPAVGASVQLVDPDADDDADNVVGRTKTDVTGVASMRAPDFLVRVAAWLGAEAAAPGELVGASEKSTITLRLTPAIVVHGRVLRDGAPEPNAEVELFLAPWFDSDFPFQLQTKSDAAGRFEFPPIPRAGVHPLNPPSVDATTKDMARGYASADMERPGAEVVVQLTPGFTLRGRFLDPAGHDAPAELWVVGSRTRKFQLDSDGRFVARLAEERLRFVASFATRSSYISDFDVEVATPPFIGDPIVRTSFYARVVGGREPGASGDVDLGEIVLQPGKPVIGLAVDASGHPVVRAEAALLIDDIVVGTVVADAKGRFEFPEVSDDAHRVEVRATGPGAEGRAVVEHVRGGDPDLRVVLAVPEKLIVKLRFLSEGDRKPVKSREIRVKAWRHGEERTCVETQCMATTTEDAMDSYRFDVPEVGSFDVEISVGGYEPHRFESVEVVAGRETSLDLLLRKKPN